MGVLRNAVGLVALVATVGGVTQAQSTHLVASTTGCFTSGSSCSARNSADLGSTDVGSGSNNPVLQFSGGGFNGFVNGSAGAFNLNSSSDNLGKITLTADDDDNCYYKCDNTQFDDQNFFLKVAFSSGPSTSFMADLDGSVSKNNGIVTFDFDNNSQLFTVDSRTYELTINDLTIDLKNDGSDKSNSKYLTGKITRVNTPATTPEPGSLALLGTGLFGLAPIARRRLK